MRFELQKLSREIEVLRSSVADYSETVTDRVIDENCQNILDTELEAIRPMGIAVDRVIHEKALYVI